MAVQLTARGLTGHVADESTIARAYPLRIPYPLALTRSAMNKRSASDRLA